MFRRVFRAVAKLFKRLYVLWVRFNAGYRNLQDCSTVATHSIKCKRVWKICPWVAESKGPAEGLEPLAMSHRDCIRREKAPWWKTNNRSAPGGGRVGLRSTVSVTRLKVSWWELRNLHQKPERTPKTKPKTRVHPDSSSSEEHGSFPREPKLFQGKPAEIPSFWISFYTSQQ